MKKTKSFSGKFLKTFLLLLIPVLVVTTIYIFKAKAQTGDVELITTYVTVGNTAPSFTTGPTEAIQPDNNPSTPSVPVQENGTIKFTAKATDANGESYYFIVCPTNDPVTASPTGGVPICTTGTKYCDTGSTAIASGTETSCTYTATSANWENEWWASVCDNNPSGSACSVPNKGSGDSGSPFYINHPPTFHSITTTPSTPAINPNASISWNATASDPDYKSATPAINTVKLLICKEKEANGGGISNGACVGGLSNTWCSSSAVTSNPSCSFTATAPMQAGTYKAYAYIVDSFNIPSQSAAQETEVTFTVNNVAPTVTNVTLNSGNDITLTESSTKEVTITAQVSDNNGCNTLLNVRAYVYRSGIGYSGCDATATPNGNYCYKVPAEPELSCSTSNCSGTTADYTCTANMQYYADPTDTGSKFASENWLATVKATDGGSLTGSAQTTTGVEVKKLIAFSISPNNITYGNVGAGVSIPLTIALTTRATGNVGINQTHHADSQTPYMCTNYSSCTGGTPISITKQQYSMTSGTAYGSGTSLSTSPATVLLKIKKPISSTAQQKNTYWGIEVPSGTVAGSYQGQNIITAVMSATSDW